MGQRRALDGDIAPVFFGAEFDVVVATQRPQRFDLEQGDLPSILPFVRVKADLKRKVVAIAFVAPV